VWGLREGITESLSRTAILSKYDLSVPVRHVVPFIEEAKKTIAAKSYALELYLFGHFGDGSPHFNLLKPQDKSPEEFKAACGQFEQDLYALLRKYGGSVSAEHGVGILKKSWLEFSRSRAELDLFRSIKNAFDPKGLLNPGKVID
jgi:FAD/FMN-containing dehydrogenase